MNFKVLALTILIIMASIVLVGCDSGPNEKSIKNIAINSLQDRWPYIHKDAINIIDKRKDGAYTVVRFAVGEAVCIIPIRPYGDGRWIGDGFNCNGRFSPTPDDKAKAKKDYFELHRSSFKNLPRESEGVKLLNAEISDETNIMQFDHQVISLTRNEEKEKWQALQDSHMQSYCSMQSFKRLLNDFDVTIREKTLDKNGDVAFQIEATTDQCYQFLYSE
ncbi:hypothetical protein SAMN02745165_03730 [Malonomonas rubra DSM 5091]|uniref:Lipoprotein n=1 Tax=Malonomonas rubra DSM 5091 TaxID=1122189 RepID=A0A1M6NWR3_MALRU|nr:hypothetical protein [Malonomonas rubra]SHK00123.1 hypothetical protein SAMN02745165_03730 [Malonomonas rubra DSM 5091]